MKKIIVQYGGDKREVNVAANATIGTIISDSTTRAYLGFGDNVKVLVHGVEQGLDVVPGDGSTVTLETKANQKALVPALELALA